MGEQSVSAIMPKLISVVSGASETEPAVAAQLLFPRAENKAAAPRPAAPRERNWRRLSEELDELRGDEFMRGLLDGLAEKIFTEETAGQRSLGGFSREQTGFDEFGLKRCGARLR